MQPSMSPSKACIKKSGTDCSRAKSEAIQLREFRSSRRAPAAIRVAAASYLEGFRFLASGPGVRVYGQPRVKISVVAALFEVGPKLGGLISINNPRLP